MTASIHARFRSPLHESRTAAILGIALGVTFATCFVTGLLSHLIQHPPGWFEWPSRPAGLYRITQGVHVTTGLVSIPLLLAKLWVVYPKLWVWPPFESVAHVLERLSLVPLVAGGLFMLFSGLFNVARWYPWPFFFPTAHYWVAWITIGALVVHIGAKAAIVRESLGRTPVAERAQASTLERRSFLGGVAGAMGLVFAATAGGTVAALGPISALAQRRPGVGPQGLPVNKTARRAGVIDAARDPAYRLRVVGAVQRELSLSLDELRALPQHGAELPIACVEGWSQSAHWRGVRVRDLLSMAGAPDDAVVTVRSLQQRGLYGSSELNATHAHDRDTLLAIELDGEPLHIDHGYPCRLIGPNRPGVMQTKWVTELDVR